MVTVLRLPNIIFLFELLRSMVITTASVPLIGDRNLRRKDVTALLGTRNRYALGLADPSEVCARFCGMGPQGGLFADCPRLTSSSLLFRSALVDTRMRKIAFVNLYLVYD